MRNILIGIVISLSIIGSVDLGIRIYKWRQYVNDAAWKANVVYNYLSEPVLEANGQKFNRAQAFDYILNQSIPKSPPAK